MIKLAVFDWNGTLLSDIALTLQATTHEFEVAGLPAVTLRQVRQNFEIPLHKYYANMGLDPAAVAAHATAMHSTFHESYEQGVTKTRTRPGTRAMLDALHKRGITRIILSNHHVRGIQEQLQRLKLDHHFEVILANDDIHGAMHVGKLARLEAYLKTTHSRPEEGFIIGDTSEEVAIGRHLGLKTIAISGGMYSARRLKAAKPDVLITSLYDLIDVIEEFEA